MLNETAGAAPVSASHVRRGRGKAVRVDTGTPRSATRPLEVLELFAVCRRPLSVSEIASALEIPQSSSSVLLQAMNGAGFVARDRKTRKYLPSVRSVLLGNRVHDGLHRHGSLLKGLEDLSLKAGANVRLGVRKGLQVQCVHVSWPTSEGEIHRLGPGLKLPIVRDALGRMLLLAESERDVRAIVRHSNAIGGGADAVNVDTFIEELGTLRAEGVAVCSDITGEDDTVLAVGLPPRFGAPAAIGFGLPAARLNTERENLTGLLRNFAAGVWMREGDQPQGDTSSALS